MKYKVHWETHPNGYTCCGPSSCSRESTTDKAKITCIKGQYAARLIASPYTGPKRQGKKGWACRITDSIERSYENNRPMDVAARNILAMMKSAGWSLRRKGR